MDPANMNSGIPNRCSKSLHAYNTADRHHRVPTWQCILQCCKVFIYSNALLSCHNTATNTSLFSLKITLKIRNVHYQLAK
jgi:hypothetical protein